MCAVFDSDNNLVVLITGVQADAPTQQPKIAKKAAASPKSGACMILYIWHLYIAHTTERMYSTHRVLFSALFVCFVCLYLFAVFMYYSCYQILYCMLPDVTNKEEESVEQQPVTKTTARSKSGTYHFNSISVFNQHVVILSLAHTTLSSRCLRWSCFMCTFMCNVYKESNIFWCVTCR